VAISANSRHTLILKSDGTVAAYGDNSSGQTKVPPGLNDVVAVAAGGSHSLALKRDGTVVGWGSSYSATPPDGLANVKAIAATRNQSFAFKNDGTVVQWGSGYPSLPSGSLVSVAQGDEHSLALTSNGTVVAAGSDSYGQATIPTNIFWHSNDKKAKAIAAGRFHSMVLTEWGAFAWGAGDYDIYPQIWAGGAIFPHYAQSYPGYPLQGQTTASVYGAVAIAAGAFHSVFLHSGGGVSVWGYYPYDRYNGHTYHNPPLGLGSVISIAAGEFYTIALTKKDSP